MAVGEGVGGGVGEDPAHVGGQPGEEGGRGTRGGAVHPNHFPAGADARDYERPAGVSETGNPSLRRYLDFLWIFGRNHQHLRLF